MRGQSAGKFVILLGAVVFALAFLLLLFLGVGCRSTGPTYDYPGDIKDMCRNAKERAKACIESKDGSELPERYGATLVKKNGTHKYNNGWGWPSPELGGMIVCGLTGKSGGRSFIQVGCNPSTGGEVNENVVCHEYGHHWRMQVNDWTHNPKYGSCFISWRDPPGTKSLMVYHDSNNWTIVDYLEDWDENVTN